MANERISFTMTGTDVIMAMTEGNPGALTAYLELMKHGREIDPIAAGGGFAHVLTLDTLNIYGCRIYMLYDYVCNRSVVKMIALLRAYQLGQLAGVTKESLYYAIDNHGAGINHEAVIAAVKEELPEFNPNNKK